VYEGTAVPTRRTKLKNRSFMISPPHGFFAAAKLRVPCMHILPRPVARELVQEGQTGLTLSDLPE
jgi:hypothetical protein